MKIKVVGPFVSMRGTYKTTDIVFTPGTVPGELIARAKVRPKDPKTPEQMLVRKINTQASRCWTSLTPAARSNWEWFTETFASQQMKRKAMNVCREAQRMRLILGHETTTNAPRLGYPAPVTKLTQEHATGPAEFRFRIEHAVEAPAGHVVLVKITPAMLTTARTPSARITRAICGLGPQSAVELPASGGTIGFSNARFAIQPGERYGVALTIIRVEDGLASQIMFFDLIRDQL